MNEAAPIAKASAEPCRRDREGRCTLNNHKLRRVGCKECAETLIRRQAKANSRESARATRRSGKIAKAPQNCCTATASM
jgi:hypothetical protein